MSNETVHPSTAFELGAAVLQQLPRNISQQVALEWIRNKKALSNVLREALLTPIATFSPVQKAQQSLLELVCTVDISAQEPFKVTNFFKEFEQQDGIEFLPMYSFENNLFRDWDATFDTDVPATTVNVYNLTATSMNNPIIAALGDKDAAKIDIAYIAHLIKAQSNGEEGVLLANGLANIFYVDSCFKELFVLRCHWLSIECVWQVLSHSIPYSNSSFSGSRIFSPAVLAP